ncbi:hypothetical protein JL722_12612 [Aureococcus anophagefferens]|nr:hypothetical protein JL722_12612 [Aureococcus anophagefferens]
MVIVKALRKAAGPFAFGDRASDIAYFELVYLEYLRGAPGVPLLHGGWETRSHVFWPDLEPGGPRPCGAAGRRSRAARSHQNHHGCRYADCANATGAPELAACEADGACARFDWRAHVFDAATRSWIFPRIISSRPGAAKRLEASGP